MLAHVQNSQPFQYSQFLSSQPGEAGSGLKGVYMDCPTKLFVQRRRLELKCKSVVFEAEPQYTSCSHYYVI